MADCFPIRFRLSNAKSAEVKEMVSFDSLGRLAWDLNLPRRLSDEAILEATWLNSVLDRQNLTDEPGWPG